MIFYIKESSQALHSVTVPADGGWRGLFQVLRLKDHVLGVVHLDNLATHQTQLVQKEHVSTLNDIYRNRKQS